MSRWPALERFLETDPRDVGCDEAMAVLHTYAEAVAAGEDPERIYPGVSAPSAAPADRVPRTWTA